MHLIFLPVHCVCVPDLQAEVRRQEEQAGEMEENINTLRKDLAKTEQARKDASIKVRAETMTSSSSRFKAQIFEHSCIFIFYTI